MWTYDWLTLHILHLGNEGKYSQNALWMKEWEKRIGKHKCMVTSSISLICAVHFFLLNHSLNISVPQEDLTDTAY